MQNVRLNIGHNNFDIKKFSRNDCIKLVMVERFQRGSKSCCAIKDLAFFICIDCTANYQ